VVNPGQGHIPIFLWKVVAPDSIALIDRDLLTLRHSRRNLISNGCAMERVRLSHQVGARLTQEENPDFIAVKLGDDGPAADIATVVQASDQLHRGGLIAVSGTSTAITRVLAGLDSEVTLRVISRERYKGYSVVSLQRG